MEARADGELRDADVPDAHRGSASEGDTSAPTGQPFALRVAGMSVAAGGLSLVAALIGIRATSASLRVPLGEDDAVVLYGFANTMIRFGWFTWNPDIGYPYGMDHALVPAPEIRMWLLMKAITIGTSDPILTLNLFFLAGFFLVGTCSYLLFFATIRRTWLAMILSVSAATLPWHFNRFQHALLADYSAVPIGLLLTFLMWRRWWFGPPLRLVLGILAAVWIGTGGAYYAFYTMLALSPVLLWRVVTDRNIRLWWREALIWLIVPLSLAVSLIAHASLARTRAVEASFTRDPLESVVFAGNLLSLFVPWPFRPRPSFYESDAMYNVVGSVAMLVTLGVVVWLITARRGGAGVGRHQALVEEINPWLRLFFWMVAWFVPGLGLLFAYTISPNLRSWGRVSVVLVFIAMVISGILVRAWTGSSARRRGLAGACLTLVVAAQLSMDPRPLLFPDGASLDVAARSFSEEVRKKLPAGCPVLQVPLMTFPEGFPQPTESMGIYDHMWPQIYAPEHRWSFGVEASTEGGRQVQRRYSKEMSARTVVSHARQDGYCALEIDESGMTQEDMMDFTRVLGAPDVSVGRWQLYALRDSSEPPGTGNATP